MSRRIVKRLKFKRNADAAMREIVERHNTVANDSVFGHKPKTAKLAKYRASVDCQGRLVARLGWELRESFDLQAESQTFQVYDHASHKYWLRGLIRRCR
jgi:hypothetical protein